MQPSYPGTVRGAREDDGMDVSIGERVDRVGGNVHDAFARTRSGWNEVVETVDLKGRVERHPYGMVLAAAGIGYVLGGGIFSRLTGKLLHTGLRLGIRLAAVPFIMDEVLGIMGVGSASGEDAAGAEK
jgi:hypothetical protein